MKIQSRSVIYSGCTSVSLPCCTTFLIFCNILTHSVLENNQKSICFPNTVSFIVKANSFSPKFVSDFIINVHWYATHSKTNYSQFFRISLVRRMVYSGSFFPRNGRIFSRSILNLNYSSLRIKRYLSYITS